MKEHKKKQTNKQKEKKQQMCRLAIANKKDFMKFDAKYGILRLFLRLEKECGGHGNGYSIIKNGKVVETRKGVKLKNSTIYKELKSKDWDWFVWHTRICSSGDISDEGCHPFTDTHFNACVAMNGTIHSLDELVEATGMIDTELLFRSIIHKPVGEMTKILSKTSPVFVGFKDNKPFAVKGGNGYGDLVRWKDTTFHASTLRELNPSEIEEIEPGEIWLNGKIIKPERKKFGKLGGYGGNWFSNSYYDDGYDWKPSKKKTLYSAEDEAYMQGYDDGYEYGAMEAREELRQELLAVGVSEEDLYDITGGRFGSREFDKDWEEEE